MIEVRVEIYVKEGVLDPEAQMMLKVSRDRLGYSSLKGGKMGKLVILNFDQDELTDAFKEDVNRLCTSFLINSNTDTYQVSYHVVESAG